MVVLLLALNIKKEFDVSFQERIDEETAALFEAWQEEDTDLDFEDWILQTEFDGLERLERGVPDAMGI